MRVVVQRVKSADVTVDGAVTGHIGPGLLVLAGFEDAEAARFFGRPRGLAPSTIERMRKLAPLAPEAACSAYMKKFSQLKL